LLIIVPVGLKLPSGFARWSLLLVAFPGGGEAGQRYSNHNRDRDRPSFKIEQPDHDARPE
jgi:hypothetical protein